METLHQKLNLSILIRKFIYILLLLILNNRFRMYQWCEDQIMPLGPGILWTLDGRYFKKRVMKAGTSLGAVQWINYMQQSDICVDSTGKRVIIQNAYYQGEAKIGKWYVDGYFKKDDHEFFLEYHGEYIFRCYLPYGLYI